jgi:hypothetical protein
MSLMDMFRPPIPRWLLQEIDDFDSSVNTMRACYNYDRETAEYFVKYLVSHSMHSFYTIQGAITRRAPWVEISITEALEALQRRLP